MLSTFKELRLLSAQSKYSSKALLVTSKEDKELTNDKGTDGLVLDLGVSNGTIWKGATKSFVVATDCFCCSGGGDGGGGCVLTFSCCFGIVKLIVCVP